MSSVSDVWLRRSHMLRAYMDTILSYSCHRQSFVSTMHAADFVRPTFPDTPDKSWLRRRQQGCCLFPSTFHGFGARGDALERDFGAGRKGFRLLPSISFTHPIMMTRLSFLEATPRKCSRGLSSTWMDGSALSPIGINELHRGPADMV